RFSRDWSSDVCSSDLKSSFQHCVDFRFFLFGQFSVNQNSTTVFVSNDFFTLSDVQLCLRWNRKERSEGCISFYRNDSQAIFHARSEERRVGKERRWRW